MIPDLVVAEFPWAALAPILVLAVAFDAYCLVDAARSEVQILPRWAWILVILLVNPLGGIAYLLMGRIPR
ncbi:MAG: PLD nuclease N-terminal domain-containing protein [Actinomycetota bacterium]